MISAERGFNPTWQRHVAAYAFAAELLPDGRLLDLGCGIGHSYHRLAPRETVGLDLCAEALEGQDRKTFVGDMRDLPFGRGEFASVLAVQSLEHVPDPEQVLAEAARVLAPTGSAMFVTPNRLTLGCPDEIIDPYHFRELDPAELAGLCEPYFAEVRLAGLFGSPRYMEIVEEERAKLARMLASDPLRLRRLVPIRAKRWLYDAMLRRYRDRPDPRAEAIEVGDFALRNDRLQEALDIVAICQRPRARRPTAAS